MVLWRLLWACQLCCVPEQLWEVLHTWAAGAYGKMAAVPGKRSLTSALTGSYRYLKAESQITKSCSVPTMGGALTALASAQPYHRVAMQTTHAPAPLCTSVLSSKVSQHAILVGTNFKHFHRHFLQSVQDLHACNQPDDKLPLRPVCCMPVWIQSNYFHVCMACSCTITCKDRQACCSCDSSSSWKVLFTSRSVMQDSFG